MKQNWKIYACISSSWLKKHLFWKKNILKNFKKLHDIYWFLKSLLKWTLKNFANENSRFWNIKFKIVIFSNAILRIFFCVEWSIIWRNAMKFWPIYMTKRIIVTEKTFIEKLSIDTDEIICMKKFAVSSKSANNVNLKILKKKKNITFYLSFFFMKKDCRWRDTYVYESW